jgi:hypothetical protein
LLCRLYIFSLFIPLEAFVKLGPLRLEPYRVLLIIGFFTWLKKGTSDNSHFVLVCFVLFSGFALVVNHGVAAALPPGGILFLEVCTSYMIGVMYVRNRRDHEKYFKLFSRLYMLIAIPSFIEFFTGFKVMHTLFEQLTGNIQLDRDLYTEAYVRFGFTRTTATFGHPILYAISSVTVIPIILAINKNNKARFFTYLVSLSGLITAVITAVTSAAIIGIVLQETFKKWYRIRDKIGGLKQVITTSIYLSMIIIQFTSNRGLVKFLAMSMTLDPSTAYYRTLQWEFTADDISSHLYFGIGNNEFTHPAWFMPSIDSYWLLNMLQFGLFSQIALLYFFAQMIKKTFIKSESKENLELLLAYRVLLISVLFLGLTVDFFDRMQPMLYFILGTSSWLFKEEKLKNANKTISKQ